MANKIDVRQTGSNGWKIFYYLLLVDVLSHKYISTTKRFILDDFFFSLPVHNAFPPIPFCLCFIWHLNSAGWQNGKQNQGNKITLIFFHSLSHSLYLLIFPSLSFRYFANFLPKDAPIWYKKRGKSVKTNKKPIKNHVLYECTVCYNIYILKLPVFLWVWFLVAFFFSHSSLFIAWMALGKSHSRAALLKRENQYFWDFVSPTRFASIVNTVSFVVCVCVWFSFICEALCNIFFVSLIPKWCHFLVFNQPNI